MDEKQLWDDLYVNKTPDQVSWYRPHLEGRAGANVTFKTGGVMKRIAMNCAAFVLIGPASLLLAVGCQQSPSSQAAEVHVDVTEKGFEPADVKVPAGKAVTLVMTRKTDQTCAKEVLFPSLNKQYPLPLNQAVRIDLPASQKGTLSYQCGEKMIGGQVVVE